MNTTKSTFAWFHNNQRLPEYGFSDVTSVTIPSVTIDDAGVYECTEYGHRSMGKHAIFQLVVRACEADKWGPNCEFPCPYCYSGGICDERSGKCVCAPGFMGVHCKTVLGRNKWGQDGQQICSTEGNPDACRGNLFCLPHPYGCSCAAGYHGIDCDQDCPAGMYGASCRSRCHCEPGISCAADTGVCSNGRCADGWCGVNCQLNKTIEQCPARTTEAIVVQTNTKEITTKASGTTEAVVDQTRTMEMTTKSPGSTEEASSSGATFTKEVPRRAAAAAGSCEILIAVFTCLLVLMLIVIIVLTFKIRSLAKLNATLIASNSSYPSKAENTGVEESGKIQLSIDNYMDYKPDPGEETKYQDIGKTPKSTPGDNGKGGIEEYAYADSGDIAETPVDKTEYNAATNVAYVNHSSIQFNNRKDSNEYEYVKS